MTEHHPDTGATPRDPVRVRAAGATHVGRVRPGNEDSLLCRAPLFAVADGMGGHEAGEVASSIAVEELDRLLDEQRGPSVEGLRETLHRAAARIQALSPGSALAAGTTVAVVATVEIEGGGYWLVMNLGDSRTYRLSRDGLEQVSVDHSVVQELVDRGEITEEQARRHPYRNMVTRALGAGASNEPDFWAIPAEPGDRMLICSDGLSGEISDAAIERLLSGEGTLEQVCERLIEAALDAGGHDNISVVVIEATDVVGSEGAPHDDTTGPRPRPGDGDGTR
ncbi:MAG: protein phosphatase 2C domain-containing protein [Brachybacterium sp.]|nr:protein phosphatase 2C domain-containing protein [Brachybacterium sp.]